ncbi:uncharacterized protein [Anabrus simplex]|uniref:uncharacterized protein n=1 Tax=Anabrus simplex TaxID=316456 RepID=UPI0035A354A6
MEEPSSLPTIDILLPSNREWRMKNYYMLVEKQRALTANLSRMPELDEEGLQSTSEEQLDKEEKSPSESIDYAKAFGRWKKLPQYCWGVSRGFWVAGEKDNKQGVPSDDKLLANGIRPNWKPRPLVPVGTENPDYKHTIEDIVKSACILSNPPRKVRFEDEEDMRRVYSLIYDVFRYKNVMTEILLDGKFFQQYPSLVGYENLVMLMLYDLYKRYFTPRPNNNGELNGIPRLKDIHQALAEARIHVAASFGRIRIKNQVCSLTDILPERLKDEKVVALEKSLATAWVNTSKAKLGLATSPVCIYYGDIDDVLHTFFVCVHWLPQRRCLEVMQDELMPGGIVSVMLRSQESWDQMAVYVENILRQKKKDLDDYDRQASSLQDRSFCLAPALLNRALLDYDLTGKVVQTHMNSPRTTAYLANLLSENCKLDGLIVFGAQERKEELEDYLQKLEIKNTTVIAERFINISPDSELLKVVSAVLANPPNTYSGVLDPVDLVCSRGGDMEMLELLTESETDRQRVMDILEEQKQTLRIAMCRPQIQLVMYETHSIVQAENNNMVTKLVNEMNQIAYERYLEEQSKLSKSAKSEEEVRDTETVLKEENPDSKEEETAAKEEGEDQGKAEVKNEVNEEEEVLLKTTDEASEIDAEGATSIDYNEDADQCNEEDVLTEKVELKTFEDAEVPPCDLFEIGELPDLCPHKTSCLDLKEEGCYIAMLKRKELVSLDAKYMISVAEMRGLFGGGPKKTPSGRGYRRRELLSMRSGSGSSGASQKARGRAAKIDLERLTAPTVASMLRTAGFEPSEDSVVTCPRHYHHIHSRVVEARRWWWEAAHHIANMDSELRDKIGFPERDINIPVLRLTRYRKPRQRAPFPMHMCLLQFQLSGEEYLHSLG